MTGETYAENLWHRWSKWGLLGGSVLLFSGFGWNLVHSAEVLPGLIGMISWLGLALFWRHQQLRSLTQRELAVERKAAATLREEEGRCKRLEEALRQSQRLVADTVDQLRDTQHRMVQQESLRALGTMASGMAHDFNNALSPIVGFTEILIQDLERHADPKDLAALAEIIRTSATDAASVVRRLREFGRKREASDVQRSLDLTELVRQAIELTRPRWQGQAQAQARTIEMELDLRPVPPIVGEEPALRELLTNLIFNAVDAMPSGGKLSFSTATEGKTVVLRVRDTGVGMTEEVRRHCLEPFYTTKGEQGTGLGLSMVHGIVQRHEGELEIDSGPGRGSVFSIRLPVQPAGKAQEPEVEVPPWHVPLRILAVDDEPLHCALFEAHLSGDGHFVETAPNATRAVELFETKPFDLVITDQAMPGMSGEQLAAVLRSMVPWQRIVLVTGFGDLMMVAGERSRHINLILSKPFTQKSLRSAVAAAMQGEIREVRRSASA